MCASLRVQNSRVNLLKVVSLYGYIGYGVTSVSYKGKTVLKEDTNGGQSVLGASVGDTTKKSVTQSKRKRF